MAKKQKSNGNGTKREEQFDIPEGFDINVGRERGEGWVVKEEGNVVQGRLLGRYTYTARGKKRAYYQIKLQKECVCEIENPDYNEEAEDSEERIRVTLPPDSIVNLDETTKLSDLESYSGNGGIYDIWLVFGKKVDIGNGQSMWNVTGPRLAMVKKPSEVPL